LMYHQILTNVMEREMVTYSEENSPEAQRPF